MTFNLIHEPWIPIRTKAGARQLVSIHEALVNAHEHLWLDSEACLENTAIHRILTAILHDAHEGPTSTRDAARIYARGNFNQKIIEKYLAEHEHRFDLFDREYPFWQIPNFVAVSSKGEDRRKPIQFLTPQHSSGGQPTIFSKTTDDKPLSITADTAARWLLTTQTFRPAVGKSVLQRPHSSPLARAAVITPQGDNLFEALALSLTTYDPEEQPEDAPVWRQDPLTVDYLATAPKRSSRGRLDEYTWMGQAVLIHPTETEEGVRVMQASWANGVEAIFPPGAKAWAADPMLIYRTEKTKTGQKRKGTMAMRANHAWRDYFALLPYSNPNLEPSALIEHISEVLGHLNNYDPIRINMSGQVAENASIGAWRSDIFTIPGEAFHAPLARQTLEQFLNDVDGAATALFVATKTLYKEQDSEPNKRTLDARAEDRMKADPGMGTFWARGELLFREFLDFLMSAAPDQITGSTPPDFLERVQKLALAAFDNSLAVGDADTGRHYRAVAIALNELHDRLPRQAKEMAQAEEVLQEGGPQDPTLEAA